TKKEIIELQNIIKNLIKENIKTKEELEIKKSVLDTLEENFSKVSEGTKEVAKKAMEQEQQLIELKNALELKTKQVDLYRFHTSKLKTNHITILPIYLR